MNKLTEEVRAELEEIGQSDKVQDILGTYRVGFKQMEELGFSETYAKQVKGYAGKPSVNDALQVIEAWLVFHELFERRVRKLGNKEG